jgi:hypothetical protein
MRIGEDTVHWQIVQLIAAAWINLSAPANLSSILSDSFVTRQRSSMP